MSKLFSIVLAALLGSGPAAAAELQKSPEPMMMVHFDFYLKDQGRLHALEHRLAAAVKRSGVGRLGETELHVDGNDGYLYLYGPDLDRLYAVVRPTLMSSKLMSGADVTSRVGAIERHFELHPNRSPK